ncbi:hypothetical protein SAMN02745150_01268 [Brevinema andersonii]|uniref:Uncharacterized protein n=1 Tax=Brevinema andersonii TaxID=34097 RepID=A0A1I1EU05_BREAD|nr:hypothetical protein [Brevinema andersonii]SFB90584.1 hypothetical protein SAMN02745150_01268 [Brevinema andersonii]
MSKPLYNKILSFILINLGIFLFLLFMNLIIAGDSWVYSATYPINPPFHIGGHHPGRHIGELLAIIPGQIIAPLLGNVIHNPFLALKISLSITNVLLMFLLIYVSTYYVKSDLSSSDRKILTILLFFMLFLLPTAFHPRLAYGWSYIFHQMMLGSLAISLSVWGFFLYYYENNRFPWNMDAQPYWTIGIMLPLMYIATAGNDTANFITLPLTFLFLCYQLLKMFTPDLFEDKTPISILAIILPIFYIVFVLFATFRNMYRADRTNGIVPALNPITWINRIRELLSFWEAWPLVAGAVVGLYYVTKIIKNRCIKKSDFFILITLTATYSSILICAVTGATYLDLSLWFLWLILLHIAYRSYYSSNTFVLAIMPITLLCLGLLSLIPLRRFVYDMRLMQNDDYKLVQLFQEAEKNKKKEIFLKESDIKQPLPVGLGWEHQISAWMLVNGYTSEYIVLITPENTNRLHIGP